jgi:hypothetical protein
VLQLALELSMKLLEVRAAAFLVLVQSRYSFKPPAPCHPVVYSLFHLFPRSYPVPGFHCLSRSAVVPSPLAAAAGLLVAFVKILIPNRRLPLLISFLLYSITISLEPSSP